METSNLARMLMERGWAITLQSTIVIPYPGSKLYAEALEKGWAVTLQSTIVTPYPGTKMYDEALANKWFRIDPKDYDRFDMDESILRTPDMESKDIMKVCDEI